MATDNGNSKPETFQESFEKELVRREEEMKGNVYGNRQYCDGVREDLRRWRTWLSQ